MTAVTMNAVLGNYPHTQALKDGTLSDPEVTFAFTEIEPIHKAFTPMVRQQPYDLSELAVVTYLQAAGFDKPLILLPAVVASRLQRGCIIYYKPNGVVTPEDLRTARIGVRAYTQTTGMWVRAALAEDYGLPIERMTWVTQDAAHVAEYQDPPIVEHAPKDKSLLEMLKSGEIRACILGNDLPDDPDYAPVIAEHRDVDLAWKAAHGFLPTNHVVVVTRSFAEAHPAAVRAAYRLLVEADAVARANGTSSGRSLYGFEQVSKALQITLATCNQQLLLPRPMTVEELLAPATALLGALGVFA